VVSKLEAGTGSAFLTFKLPQVSLSLKLWVIRNDDQQTTKGKLKKYWAPLVVAEMVTFLITSLIILVFLAVAVYFWQKPASSTKTEILTPPPGRGLFIDGTPEGVALAAAEADSKAIGNADRRRIELLGRAKGGEKSTLQEAQLPGMLFSTTRR